MIEPEQDDTELVAGWLSLVMGRYTNDAERAGAIGASKSAVGMWRTAIKAGERVGVAARYRKAMKDYLTRNVPGSGDAYRDGVRAAIAELRARLDEMEERL